MDSSQLDPVRQVAQGTDPAAAQARQKLMGVSKALLRVTDKAHKRQQLLKNTEFTLLKRKRGNVRIEEQDAIRIAFRKDWMNGDREAGTQDEVLGSTVTPVGLRFRHDEVCRPNPRNPASWTGVTSDQLLKQGHDIINPADPAHVFPDNDEFE